MLLHLIRILMLWSLFPDAGGGGKEDGKGDDQGKGGKDGDESSDGDQSDSDDDDEGDDEPLGDSGKRALARERARAAEAEKKRKDAERRLAAIEKKQRDADEAAAKEQGDFKSLYEKLQEEHKQLQTDRETERLQSLREKAARTHNIPDDMVTKIEGEDEASIDADAKKMAQYLKGREAPDLDAGDQGGDGNKKRKSKDNAKYKDPSYWGIS